MKTLFAAGLGMIICLSVLSCAGPSGLQKADSYRQAGLFAKEVDELNRLISSVKEEKVVPDLFLRRGQSYVQLAQELRRDRASSPITGGVFANPKDLSKYVEYYELAESDFTIVVDKSPRSKEAAEAQFMLGLINDHPHLNRFDEALEAYEKTIELYPRSTAAEKARERKSLIESYQEGINRSPHGDLDY